MKKTYEIPRVENAPMNMGTMIMAGSPPTNIDNGEHSGIELD